MGIYKKDDKEVIIEDNGTTSYGSKIKGVDDETYGKATSTFTESQTSKDAQSKADGQLGKYADIANKDSIVGSDIWKTINNSFTTPSAVTEADTYLKTQLSKIQNGKTSFADSISSIMDKIANRDKFSYDVDNDPLFQQALASAMKSGKIAMQDTIGQASALTGGYGSSYATTAGNQAYNAFIEDAYNNLPEYYQMALEAYEAEGEELYRQLDMYNTADDTEYGRMMDAYNTTADYRDRIYDESYQQYRDSKSDAFASADLQISEHSQLSTDAYNLYSAYASESDKLYEREYNQWVDEVANVLELAGMQNTDWWNQTTMDWETEENQKDRDHETSENQKDRDFTAGENEKDRAHETDENQKDRDHETSENQKDRDFTAGENEKDRAHETDENQKDRDHETSENQKDRDFTAGENQKDRDHETSENQKDRDFTAGENQKDRDHETSENQKDRDFTASENAADRAHESSENAADRAWETEENQKDRDWESAENDKDRADSGSSGGSGGSGGGSGGSSGVFAGLDLANTEVTAATNAYNGAGGGEAGLQAAVDTLAMYGKVLTSDEELAALADGLAANANAPITPETTGTTTGFNTSKGSAFKMTTSSGVRTMINNGSVTSKNLESELKKYNVAEGKVFTHNGKMYVKSGGDYYSVAVR